MNITHPFPKNERLPARRHMSEQTKNICITIGGGVLALLLIGQSVWSEKKLQALQQQLSEVDAYKVRIDGKNGPYTETALVKLQAYCMNTLPDELGKYTQSVKNQLTSMIANGQKISDCPNYPKEIPSVLYNDEDDKNRNNILKKNVIENIQKDLIYIHGFQGLVDGWAGAKTNTGVANFQYHCLPAGSYTLGKIDDYTIEQIHTYAQAGKRVSSCEKAD